ncbi:MAG TPA: hypothetical protein VFM18_00935 [Methanosarcina sp.]|nr:hypothetical protein [Methanosarcina sp.]
MSVTPRIGFACKFHSDNKSDKDLYSLRGIILKTLQSLSANAAYQRLLDVVLHNLTATQNLLSWVSTSRPIGQGMVRLSGDIFPLGSHPHLSGIYYDIFYEPLVVNKIRNIRNIIESNDIRVTMHPGQFTVLGSNNPNVVSASLAEIRHHANILGMFYDGLTDARRKGAVINIHVGSSSANVAAVRSSLRDLNPFTAALLSFENDEFSWGLERIVDSFGDIVRVVPDLHHHWVETGGYLRPDDPILQDVLVTWGGIRPKLHCAMSREEYLLGKVPAELLPSRDLCLNNLSLKRTDIRKHSDTLWHPALLDYYCRFLPDFDIMVEAKHKQVASQQLYYRARELGAIE